MKKISLFLMIASPLMYGAASEKSIEQPGPLVPFGIKQFSPIVSATFGNMMNDGIQIVQERQPSALDSDFGKWMVALAQNGIDTLEQDKETVAKSEEYSLKTMENSWVTELVAIARTLSDHKAPEFERAIAWGAFGMAFSLTLKQLMEADVAGLDLRPTAQGTITHNTHLTMTPKNTLCLNAGELSQATSLQTQYDCDPETYAKLFAKWTPHPSETAIITLCKDGKTTYWQ